MLYFSCRLGDLIDAQVLHDPQHQDVYLLCSLQVLETWKDGHRGSYIPQPLTAQSLAKQDTGRNSHAGHHQVQAGRPEEGSTHQICKFWINTGGCPKGNDCRFEHPEGPRLKAERTLWVSGR